MIVVFDLDDTLYPEISYVRSGFRAVAADLAARHGLDPDGLAAEMDAELEAHGRGAVFDAVLARHGLESPDAVAACVETYRGHTPQLALAPGAAEVLDALAADPSGRPLYLVTDGDPDVQAAKIAALGIEPRFAGVYRTWVFGADHAKPSLLCFEDIARREGVTVGDLCYVADDPSKDFVNLRRAGAVSVRVMTGRHRDTVAQPGYDADLHIPDISSFDLGALLSRDTSTP